VESSRLFERVLSRLSADTTDVVIVVEQQGYEDTNRESDEYPFDRQCPEMDQPATIRRGIECPGDGQREHVCSLDRSRNVDEAGPEYRSNLKEYLSVSSGVA